MEKTNKYYGIIEEVVKNNKKFAGLEAILDDIIDDVYSHSETVINSIKNEAVILSYIEKIVASSIITVPKKIGYNTNIKHRIITNDVPEKTVLNDNNKLSEEQTAYVDNMINNATNTPEIHDSEAADNEVLSLTEEDSDLLDNDLLINETIDVDENLPEAEQIEQETLDPDTDLHDNFIMEETEEVPEGVQQEELTIDETAANEVIDELQTDELVTIDALENEIIEGEEENQVDELIDFNSHEEGFTEDITEDIMENADDTIDSSNDNSHISHEIDYSPFELNINSNAVTSVDYKQIADDIADLSTRYQDLKISEIFNLRYKNKRSVSDIAIELNMNEDSVIEALNELVRLL